MQARAPPSTFDWQSVRTLWVVPSALDRLRANERESVENLQSRADRVVHTRPADAGDRSETC